MRERTRKIGRKFKKNGPENERATFIAGHSGRKNLFRWESFRTATWNLHGGLHDGSAFATVVQDLVKRKIAVACLQETHRVDGMIHSTPQAGRILCIAEPDSTPARKRFGLGFYVADELWDNCMGYRQISNRIAILRLQHKSMTRTRPVTISIINVYGPTTQYTMTRQGRREIDLFYNQLQETYLQCRRESAIVIIGGDWNSKLGLRRNISEGSSELFMGNFGKGSRNTNGERLASFLSSTGLYATNTRFQHPMRHRSTWSGILSQHDGTSKQFFNQIDYIAIDQSLKHCVKDARAYNGQSHVSDHSLVVSHMNLYAAFKAIENQNWRLRVFGSKHPYAEQPKRRTSIGRQVNIRMLSEPATHKLFVKHASKNLSFILLDEISSSSSTLSVSLNKINDAMEAAALSTLPMTEQRNNGRVEYLQDTILQNIISHRREIHEKIRKIKPSDNGDFIVKLKSEQRKLNKERQKRVRQLQEMSLVKLAKEIEATPDSRRKFEVTRIMRRHSSQSFQLKTAEGYMTQAPSILLDLTAKHFEKFFNPPGHTTPSIWGEFPPSSLDIPIEKSEVEFALNRLNNGRTVGPDGIPGELLKYGGPMIAITLKTIFNQMFERQEYLTSLGEGLLVPLNKPGKEHTVDNVRPITLLNMTRKTLSLVVLHRMKSAVQSFVPLSQCGFRAGRSTMDAAWAYAWLKAMAWKYKRAIHIIGIDMSKAFDTVHREKLLSITDKILDNSTRRIVRVLVADTSLQITLQGLVSNKFKTVMGIPQGDGLSPVLFIIYLEAAMREVRELDAGLYGSCGFGKYPRWGHSLTELSYADDVDFIGSDKNTLDALVEKIAERFSPWNLKVNVGKTERRTIFSELRQPTKYKKLGAQIDTDLDVQMRVQKADTVFHSMWNLWRRELLAAGTETRMLIYNACIKPILMYNIAATPLTEKWMEKLEAAHRRHLRFALKIIWPKTISNKHLYEKAQTVLLRKDIWERKFGYFRTALLQPRTAPGRECMEQYFRHLESAPRRKGNTPLLIMRELHIALKTVNLSLISWANFEQIREKASGDIKEWNKMVNEIIATKLKSKIEQSQMKYARITRTKRPLTQDQLEPDDQPDRQRRRLIEDDLNLPTSEMIDENIPDTNDDVTKPRKRPACVIEELRHAPPLKRVRYPRDGLVLVIPTVFPGSSSSQQSKKRTARSPQHDGPSEYQLRKRFKEEQKLRPSGQIIRATHATELEGTFDEEI
jgi:exonuclease III